MTETKIPLSFSSTQSVALWAVIPLTFLVLKVEPIYPVVFAIISLAMAVFSISDWGSNNVYSIVAFAVGVVTFIAALFNYMYPLSVATIGYSNMIRALLALYALDLILVISLSNKWKNMWAESKAKEKMKSEVIGEISG